MTLYSWLLGDVKKPSINNAKINNDLMQATKSVSYIENYTMWPTAKIKTNIDIAIVKHSTKPIPINRNRLVNDNKIPLFKS